MIIPQCWFNVNIFTKSLCPILTAAEGFILGVGAKMFTIAGPVMVYGSKRDLRGYLLDNDIVLTGGCGHPPLRCVSYTNVGVDAHIDPQQKGLTKSVKPTFYLYPNTVIND